MDYGLTLATAPATEPVSLTEAKAHLRIDHDAEDALIAAYIAAARALTEEYTHQRWITQEVVMTLSRFPGYGHPIALPVQPVQTVDEIAYLHSVTGVSTVYDAADYQLWLGHTPPVILPTGGEDWPETDDEALSAVTIELTVGYGDDATDVPPQVKAAMLLVLGDYDKNRAGEADGQPRTLPQRARDLLDTLWTGAYR